LLQNPSRNPKPYAQNPHFSKLSLSLFQGETLPKTSSETLHKKTAAPARAPSLTLARRILTNFSNFHFHFGKAKPYQSQGGIILILI
jgi:hypothetical protein